MRINKIYRYPVKSMGGEELRLAHVAPNGIVGDRRYALLDVESGAIASAKSPKKWGNLLKFSARYISEPTKGEHLPPVAIRFPDGGVRRTDSPDIDLHLSKALKRNVRIVTEAPQRASTEVMWRVVKGQEATEWTRQRTVGVENGQDVVLFELAGAVPHVDGEDTFLDIASIHLITSSSLRRLEELSPGVRFDHRRYRPNFLVDSSGPGFIEQEWDKRTIWAGNVGMSVLIPTPRCVMSTLAHEGLGVDRRTLKSIVRHNTLTLDVLPGRWGCVGIYATPIHEGVVEVGYPLSVEAARPHIAASSRRDTDVRTRPGAL